MNKIKNPIRIDLHGVTGGYEASEWCSANLVFEDWDMWIGNRWSHYIFEFANSKDATIFALKWGHFV